MSLQNNFRPCKNCRDPWYDHKPTTDGHVICKPLEFKDGILLGSLCDEHCEEFIE